jgi:phosphopantetheinyl transferase/acyl carrier protein
MYADGARVFVEVGPRANLTAFVDDCLRGRPHVAMATNHHAKPGLLALHHAIGQLAALHVPMNLSPLYEGRGARRLSLDPEHDRPVDEAREPGAMLISLCCPKLRLSPEAARSFAAKLHRPARLETISETAGCGNGSAASATDRAITTAPPSPSAEHATTPSRPQSTAPSAGSGASPQQPPMADADAVMQQHFRLMEDFLRTNAEIMQALLGRGSSPAQIGDPPANLPALEPLARPEPPLQEPTAAHLPAFIVPASSVTAPAPEPTEAKRPTPAAAGANAAPTVSASEPVERIGEVLLAIVSERTGYPPDMLDLDLDMEADLGIDSIKRVEILGALQNSGGARSLAGEIDMEEVAKLKTLRQIVCFLEKAADASLRKDSRPPSAVTADSTKRSHEIASATPDSGHSMAVVAQDSSIAPASPAVTRTAPGAIADAAKRLAFSMQVVDYAAGTKIVLQRCIDIDQDLYLHDHCFDPYISDTDPDRERLGIVPLTVSLEMMAEAACLLAPDRRLIAARNVQAGKWIEVEPGAPRVQIEITASRRSPDEIQVAMRFAQLGPDANGASSSLAEAVFVFADAFPEAPVPASHELSGRRTPAHTARQMYDERRMFHGPRFRGVASIDAVGENGLAAKLEVLPMDQALRGCPNPRFFIDPFLLDAAGQLVGYWPVEYLTEGFVLFPIRIQELTLYRENLTPGERAECRLRIVNVAKRQLRADMDVIAPDGKLWMRITGWEDWRFYWEPDFYNFWRYPYLGMVSTPLSLPVPDGSDLECRRMEPFGEMGSSMWENLWAHLILCRRELDEYRAMQDGARRTQWIFGRAAAKDAVRSWVRRNIGLALYPADVEIAQDEHGKPSATGDWVQRVGEAPQVSISHKGNVAVAAAGRMSLGIDLETIARRDDGFESLAFNERERSLITAMNGGIERDEWLTRAWCAKEAAGKAAGNGLRHNPKNLAVRSINPANGRMVVTCGGDPGAFEVHSVRDGEFIIAVAFCERNQSAGVGSE